MNCNRAISALKICSCPVYSEAAFLLFRGFYGQEVKTG